MIKKAAAGVIAASRRRGAGGVSTYFGSTNGNSANTNLTGAFKMTQAFTCPGNGTAQKGRFWFNSGGPAQMALYANSIGSPAALLCQSNQVSFPGTAGYVDFPFTTNPALTNGTLYWICIFAPTSTVSFGHVASPAQIRYYNNAGGLSNPFGTLSGGDTIITIDMGAYVLI